MPLIESGLQRLGHHVSSNLAHTNEQLCDKATSAVNINGIMEEWFKTTVGVRQGRLLFPTLVNIFSRTEHV